MGLVALEIFDLVLNAWDVSAYPAVPRYAYARRRSPAPRGGPASERLERARWPGARSRAREPREPPAFVVEHDPVEDDAPIPERRVGVILVQRLGDRSRDTRRSRLGPRAGAMRPARRRPRSPHARGPLLSFDRVRDDTGSAAALDMIRCSAICKRVLSRLVMHRCVSARRAWCEQALVAALKLGEHHEPSVM